MSSSSPRLDLPPATAADRPRLGPADEGRLVPGDEFAAATFAEPWVYERVVGRLVVMSPEGKDHVRSSTPWLTRLSAYALTCPDRVQAVVPSPWVRIDANTDRIGDIGVYLGGLLDDLDIPDQVPDLIFEFVSPSKQDRHRDYVLKRAEYHQVGVREYVIIDRFQRKVTVLSFRPEGYAERIIPADGIYESPLLPGLVIALTEVWPR